MALLGDSVTYRSSLDLRKQLMAQGWYVCLLGVSSATTANVLDQFFHFDQADVVVIATGANDSVLNLSAMPGQVIRAHKLAGNRPLLWVNLWMQRTLINQDVAAGDAGRVSKVNHVITAGRQRHLITAVVDWNGFINARPGRSAFYLTDGLHTNRAGALARAHLISQLAKRYTH